MKITFVTGNQNKFAEAKEIIPELEMHDLDLVEIQDTDSQKIIEAKLMEAKNQIQGNIIVEDNSLTFSCLGALPGPLIKWFMKEIGNDKLFKLCESFQNFEATAKVVIGFSDENGTTNYFEGSLKGKIVSPIGENGFGWDAIFIPDGYTKTFAQMSSEEKNQISMRKIAFQKLSTYLKK